MEIKPAIMALLLAVQAGPAADSTSDKDAQMERGHQLFLKNCLICHQMNGQGMPGAYPPLAKSDFLLADRERALQVLCEGLNKEIRVNGKKYNGIMPPVVIEDREVADLMTYVFNSWGNTGDAVTAEEVKSARAKTEFKTFDILVQANAYPPLPAPPEGFNVREVVRMPQRGVRLASDGLGQVLYVLIENGDVYRLVPTNGLLQQILWGNRYLEKRPGDLRPPEFVLAMTLDRQKRLYLAANQLNGAQKPIQNIVTIYRTTAFSEIGDPIDPKPWFQTNYPGSPELMHGVENMQFGPDGWLYVGNGARTDANQPRGDTNYFQGGETPITSCLWRFNPELTPPRFEIYARGIRNAYGFCWNDAGEMFATDNGPDADAPDELNHIQQGHHYGFPYTFSNWGSRKAYPFSPDAPPGLKLTLPIANLGPAGGVYGKPEYTFDPHSAPEGMTYLGNDFPEGWRGTFLVARFGNFLKTPRDNVGYDLLQAKIRKNAQGVYEAQMTTVLAPLGRPIDVHRSGPGKIYVCEYSRGTNSATSYSLPGRIIELSVDSTKPAAHHNSE
jgi:glucose/arabinose dehydrogenase/mono/diheme cytochrome c family protein